MHPLNLRREFKFVTSRWLNLPPLTVCEWCVCTDSSRPADIQPLTPAENVVEVVALSTSSSQGSPTPTSSRIMADSAPVTSSTPTSGMHVTLMGNVSIIQGFNNPRVR